MIVSIYFIAIVCANLLVAWLGPWFSPVNAFVLIGLDLSLRDTLHERWQGRQFWPRMLALIAGAGIVSYLLNPASAQIAVASVSAFVLANLADTLVYQRFLNHPWMVKSNASNVAGALVDSLVFPTLAFGVLMPSIVVTQFAAKVLGGAIWSKILSAKVRA